MAIENIWHFFQKRRTEHKKVFSFRDGNNVVQLNSFVLSAMLSFLMNFNSSYLTTISCVITFIVQTSGRNGRKRQRNIKKNCKYFPKSTEWARKMKICETLKWQLLLCREQVAVRVICLSKQQFLYEYDPLDVIEFLQKSIRGHEYAHACKGISGFWFD